MIRYLRQEEKSRTFPLWREAFYQDSEAFLEYYYREKARDNRILVKVEKGTGWIRSGRRGGWIGGLWSGIRSLPGGRRGMWIGFLENWQARTGGWNF